VRAAEQMTLPAGAVQHRRDRAVGPTTRSWASEIPAAHPKDPTLPGSEASVQPAPSSELNTSSRGDLPVPLGVHTGRDHAGDVRDPAVPQHLCTSASIHTNGGPGSAVGTGRLHGLV
jgi:hypothetical protein